MEIQTRAKEQAAAALAHHAQANATRSAVRSAVERVMAEQKHRMKLFVRAEVKIGTVNTFKRLT